MTIKKIPLTRRCVGELYIYEGTPDWTAKEGKEQIIRLSEGDEQITTQGEKLNDFVQYLQKKCRRRAYFKNRGRLNTWVRDMTKEQLWSCRAGLVDLVGLAELVDEQELALWRLCSLCSCEAALWSSAVEPALCCADKLFVTTAFSFIIHFTQSDQDYYLSRSFIMSDRSCNPLWPQ